MRLSVWGKIDYKVKGLGKYRCCSLQDLDKLGRDTQFLLIGTIRIRVVSLSRTMSRIIFPEKQWKIHAELVCPTDITSKFEVSIIDVFNSHCIKSGILLIYCTQ